MISPERPFEPLDAPLTPFHEHLLGLLAVLARLDELVEPSPASVTPLGITPPGSAEGSLDPVLVDTLLGLFSLRRTLMLGLPVILPPAPPQACRAVDRAQWDRGLLR
jgi:hypothetical protein